jgi:hypothetical protein
LGERSVRNAEVEGSNPFSSTSSFCQGAALRFATLAHCEPCKLIGEAWAAALVLRPTTPFLRLLKGGIANYEIIASQLRNDYGSVSSCAVLRR